MCGISALIHPEGAAALHDVVGMNDIIAHRGPDSEGYVVLADRLPAVTVYGPDTDPACPSSGAVYAPTVGVADAGGLCGHVVLGHRRLSILDLSPTGHQPMSDEQGSLWITFNGEVYNFVELRSELEDLGHHFRGTGDTEVLLASYSQWGTGAFERLRGMFAFVLVDRTRGLALAVRDRFGIKPLYYGRTPDGGLAMGSEIKQLLLRGGPARMNGPRLYDFLNFAIHDHSEQTMVAGVSQVRPGCFLQIPLAEPQALQEHAWYELVPMPFEGSFSEAAAAMRGLLEQSVLEHLRADVPVGSCLSGGLDSSTIVCLVQRQLRESRSSVAQRTFTATSSDRKVDETDWAHLVSSAVGAETHFVEPDLASLPAVLDRLVWHMDEPFGSSSIFAQWCVFQLAASSGTKVLLDGQGADEQLAGYMPFFAWRLVELASAGQLREVSEELRALRRVHPEVLRRTMMLVGYLMTPRRLGRQLGRLVRAPGQVPDLWLSRSMLGVEGYPDPLEASGARRRGVQALAASQLTASNLPMLLHYEDRDSMAHSVEARVPFLDHRVVEFASGLPSSYLIGRGETKRVLRASMRGVLPERTRTRVDKIGFQTAEERWMREHPTLVRALVGDAVDALQGAVLPDVLARLERVQAGNEPFDYWIWRVISAGAWAQRFAVTL